MTNSALGSYHVNSTCFIGIDVQVKRGCSYYVLDQFGNKVTNDWASTDSLAATAKALGNIVRSHAKNTSGQVAVGIDAPRCPLINPRRFFWNSKQAKWRSKSSKEKGYGRHCEVVVKALKIANPQWTPLLADTRPWMKLGYAIFEAMPPETEVYEVFPTASYSLLNSDSEAKVSIDFSNFASGPKDMLDACIAAVTVREFIMGRGFEVGGGDGLGTIILPRKSPINDRIREVLVWPR